MTTRLVWFLIFLSALTAIATLGSYKKVFLSPTKEVITLDSLEKKTMEAPMKKVVAQIDNIELGKQIYETAQCAKCHGVNGGGNPAELGPKIAGQHDWYLLDQLKQMKAQTRVNEKMYPHIEKLQNADFEKLSEYISSLSAQ